MLRITLALLAVAAPAAAQTLPFTLNSLASQVDLDVSFELRLPGTLIGDFDPVTNPGGTQTLPGLLGGSGNQPVDIQVDLIGALDVAGPAQGTFRLTTDAAQGTGELDGLDLEVLVGGAAAADLTLQLTYDTFRTVAPSSLFLSLVPLPIPLGQVAIGDVDVTQSGPVQVALAPTATPGIYDVTGLVPVELSFVFDLGGTPTPVGPIPAALPLAATVDLAACDATLTGAATAADVQVIPAPFPLTLEDIPLPLPTILPPGGIANVLLTVELDELAFDYDVAVAVDGAAPAAARVERYCTASPNSAGLGAPLDALGSTSIGADDLVFSAAGLPANSFGYLLMSPAEDEVPGFSGSQGVLCLGTPCYRFSEDVQSSGPGGSIAFDPALAALPMGVVVAPGESWRFQYWYRDANPGVTSNTTDALRVTFCQ